MNADGYVSTGTDILGFNMFAYCNNDPVNCIDSTGTCTTNARGDRIPYKCTSKCIYDYRSIRNKQNYAAKGKGAVQMVLDIGTNATIRMLEIAPKPNNIGKGIHSKAVQMRIDNINSFSKVTQYTFDAFDVLIIGHEIYINAMDNYVNNQGSVKIVWDGAVDAGVLITNACLTTAITVSAGAINPFLGITMGAGAGFALDTSGEYARREMKSWVK